jgi:hypothetical protein
VPTTLFVTVTDVTGCADGDCLPAYDGAQLIYNLRGDESWTTEDIDTTCVPGQEDYIHFHCPQGGDGNCDDYTLSFRCVYTEAVMVSCQCDPFEAVFDVTFTDNQFGCCGTGGGTARFTITE